jgi:hypothetical protein
MRDKHGKFISDKDPLHASVISTAGIADTSSLFFLEIETDPEHGTAMLRCGIDGKVTFPGPFDAEQLLYVARYRAKLRGTLIPRPN